MLLILRRELASIKAAMEHMELCDLAYTKDYVVLNKQRKILVRTIKKLERIEKQYDNH